MTTSSDETWLCRIDRINRMHDPTVGALLPLAWRSADGWTTVSAEEARTLFPDRGQAVWFEVPPGVDRNDLVLVRVEARRNYRRTGDAEAFQVASWAHAVEVLDLRAWDGDRSVRIALTQDGLDVALSTSRVLIRLDDEVAAGPVTLERTADGRWRVPEGEHEDVEVRRLLDSHVSSVAIGAGHPTIVHDLDGVGRPVRLLNWTSDLALAQGLLGRLRKLDPEAVKALGVSKAVYKQYVESYPGFQFQSDRQRDQEAARFDRVEDLVRVVERDERLLAAAAEALLSHPSVAQSMELPKQAAVEEVRRQARAGAEEALADIRAEADAARRERDALAQERDALERLRDELLQAIVDAERAVDAAQRDADERMAGVEAALDARLAEIAVRPAAFFAEAALFRALTTPRWDGEPSRAAASNGPPLTHTVRSSAASTDGSPVASACADDASANAVQSLSLDDAVSDIAVAIRAAGGDFSLAPTLLGAFLTGRVVVVAGDGAHSALRALADRVVGGRLTWIPAAPTLASSDELFGRYDAASGRFVPHPGGLLAVLDAAADSDNLSLVVVEGYDRAPAEHYLAALVQAYADSAVERGARAVPLVGPGGSARRVAWPANVLLACVPGGGSGAVPPGTAFWQHALLVDAGDAVLDLSRDRPASQVPAAAWTGARAAVADAARGGDETPFPDPEAAPYASRASRLSYAASLHLGLGPPAARRAAFVAAWLPRWRAPSAAVQAALDALGADTAPLDGRVEQLLASVRPI